MSGVAVPVSGAHPVADNRTDASKGLRRASPVRPGRSGGLDRCLDIAAQGHVEMPGNAHQMILVFAAAQEESLRNSSKP